MIGGVGKNDRRGRLKCHKFTIFFHKNYLKMPNFFIHQKKN